MNKIIRTLESRENKEDLVITIRAKKGVNGEAYFREVKDAVKKYRRWCRAHGDDAAGFTVQLFSET